MKEELIFKKSNGGFSTLEMLIAMTILILVISTVMLVSFGNQSMLIDSQTNAEALSIAQGILEKEQALARKDFKLVNSIATTTDEIYQIKVDVVSTSSDPSLVFFTKKITATVSWAGEHNRNLSVSLSTLVTNFENAVGGDTCDSVLTGNWANPIISTPSIFVSNTNSGASLSVDAYKQKLYMAISDATATDTPTLFVYSLTPDPENPSFLTSLDNADIEAGINDIHVTDFQGTPKYLYAANAYGASFDTCTNPNGTNTSCGQLQIIDLSISPMEVKYTLKILGVTGSGGQAIGKSIFYKDGFIYLGLSKTDSGPEFNIIDVHNFPTNIPSWIGGYSVGSDIKDIYVKGNYAYLATDDNTKELIILDISDRTNPIETGFYDAAGSAGLGYGKSLYIVGDILYLGRTEVSSDKEFYILNISDPANISVSSSQAILSSVNGLLIRDYLAFLVINNQLQIWRIDDPANITSYAVPLSLPSAGGTSIDCEGNYLYVGSVNSFNQGYLSVISAP